MNRQAKKRIAALATDIFLQEHNIGHPEDSRRQRRENARLLRKRVLKETPAANFEKHRIEKPRIIIPEVEIQAEGITDQKTVEGKQERRSESGRIILLT